MQDYAVGEKVAWDTPQGMHTGKIIERRVAEFMLGRQRITASEAKPVYLVESDSNGARVAHSPEVLHRAT